MPQLTEPSEYKTVEEINGRCVLSKSEDNKLYVVKTYSKLQFHLAKERDAVIRDTLNLKRLSHPFIARIDNAWLTVDNEMVMVSEYAGSSSLHKMC